MCVRAWGERGRETVSYAYVCVSIVLEWEIQSVCEIGPESKKKKDLMEESKQARSSSVVHLFIVRIQTEE